MVCGISKELTTEHYHNASSIADRYTVISRKWEELQNKLDDLRGTLSLYHDLMSVFSEMEDGLTDMGHIEVRLEMANNTCMHKVLSFWGLLHSSFGYFCF